MPSDCTRVVRRPEDMSPDGSLELIWQDDGDVIVVVRESGGAMASVEFCASGGRSPATLAQLRELFGAMEDDNAPARRWEGDDAE